jgi:hypothetical protein
VRKNQKTYSFFNRLSAALMIVTLLWLTVSTPFVFAARQEITKIDKSVSAEMPVADNEEEANPFGNTTEEKAPGSINLAEEFLHDHHIAECFFSVVSKYHKSESASTYIAFHGELLVPPPNAA